MPPRESKTLRSTAANSRTSSLKRGSLMDHLATAEAYSRLAEQAQRLKRLQTLLDSCLPAYLAPGTRVANLKRGTVIIHADSGAVAVKLRQLAPRLVEGFNQLGQEVTGIQVRVQASGRFGARSRQKAPMPLGHASKQALTSLAAGLEDDSPLKRSIEKLLGNAK